MKISTKGIYALEIITDLAMHTGDGALESIGSIARRRGLSVKYSERLIKELKEQGLVVSIRGAHGGYCLGRDAGEITVREVLQAEEGELAPVECLTRETDCGIDCNTCATREIWSQIWQIILDTAQEVTIGDIIEKSKNLR